MRLPTIAAMALLACGETETPATQDAGATNADAGTDAATVPDYSPIASDRYGKCPEGWFLWNELQGGGSPSDGLCHKTCTVDADCTPAFPNCWEVGLSLGGDYGCNGTAKFCAAEMPDQCAR